MLLGVENHNETLHFQQFRGRAELLNAHLQCMVGRMLVMGIIQKRRTRTKGKEIKERVHQSSNQPIS